MKAVVGFMLIITLLACKQDASHVLLQQNEIKLVRPRLKASNTIIDSTVTLTAELRLDKAKIFYTENGEEPTEKSLAYQGPIIVSEAATYRFKAFHPFWRPSETEEIKFVMKGCNVDSIIWLQPLNDQYFGQGPRTLVNHVKASNNYLNREWLGFDKPVGLVCKFEQSTRISSIDIGYLSHPGAWIFPPAKITIDVSHDGIHFKKKSEEVVPVLQKAMDASLATYHIELNEDVFAIRILFDNVQKIPEWHDGAGNEAWLFMDEIIFNK